MASSAPKILLTGATGYIGGTVLTALLASGHPQLTAARISVLLRDADGTRSAILQQAYGERVVPIPMENVDDSAQVAAVAAQHDVVINTANGFHETFGAALVRGLGQRQAPHADFAPIMLHTSGTTNVADRPLTETAHPEREFDDAHGPATYEWETAENARAPYAQRTAELAVVDAGLATGVRTVVLMSPTIYGVGAGLFNQHSLQIPRYTRYVLQHGEGMVIGAGAGVWDNVHIEDLGDLYVLLLTKLLDGADVPTGREGILFSGSRRHTWKEMAQRIAEAAHARGQLRSPHVRQLSIAETEEKLGNARRAELGLASNSKTVASTARRLGWQPRHGDASWKQGFHEELEYALANP